MRADHIRNFAIIAHIDHGKSTLADRLLERTGTVAGREMRAQVLDAMDLERERGITIKMHAISMAYTARDGETYELNLIDTPGHVDFAYEVSRSMAAAEGALLVVDAAQGIEAQTLSNLFLALENDLEIVPVLNKIDLPNARPDLVTEELVNLLGVDEDEIIAVSAKLGTNIDAVLEAIVERIPAPEGDPEGPLRALIFDSQFDKYRGAVPYIRVVDGRIAPGLEIAFFSNDATYEVTEVGRLRLGMQPAPELRSGEVGYLVASIKRVADTKVGDTITEAMNRAAEPLPGYREVHPMVFAGLYPTEADRYTDLRDALEKLRLNDSSLFYEPETSSALGFGFRCGFLGMLHREIVQERLEREFDLDLITTVPNVEYHVHLEDGERLVIENPSRMPNAGRIARVEEPFVRGRFILPATYIGGVLKLCEERRGSHVKMEYIDSERVEIEYDLPLAEIITDFYDRLKSATRGYASFDYEFREYGASDLVKLDILVNGDPLDALSVILHRDRAYDWGRQLSEKLKELIPRQMFEVVIQAAIGTRVISREVVRPLRKNVTAKCYGGDITRKRKLLERQREGKRRMKQVGTVEIPQEAFLAALQLES
ncbi:MAG TPA: translation elongation factor 4 [Gemmatimonadota bacterium]|nr:translation elongation factor 4 [Gemmatimonadota bacterium]